MINTPIDFPSIIILLISADVPLGVDPLERFPPPAVSRAPSRPPIPWHSPVADCMRDYWCFTGPGRINVKHCTGRIIKEAHEAQTSEAFSRLIFMVGVETFSSIGADFPPSICNLRCFCEVMPIRFDSSDSLLEPFLLELGFYLPCPWVPTNTSHHPPFPRAPIQLIFIA